MTRKRIVAVLCVGVAALGLVAWKATARQRSLLAVERRDLVAQVDVDGELRAQQAVTIGPPQVASMWTFKVSFLIPEGSEVHAGDPVVGFDTTELLQTMREKVGQRDSAAKELEKKTSELAIERQDLELELAEARARLRKEALELDVPAELVARQELETARVDDALAKTEIASLESRLAELARRSAAELAGLRAKRDDAAQRVAELQANLAAMQVTAPRAGTVLYARDERGEKTKIGDSVWRAKNVLEIPDLRTLDAEGLVDEAEMGRVRIGQPVRLRLDAHPDQSFHGRIAAVRRTVESRTATDPARVARVRIALDHVDAEAMRPGMRFRGEIEVERVKDAVCLPVEAVAAAPAGAGRRVAPSVTVVRGWRRERVTPRLGRRDDTCFEVLSGLAPGDRVVTAGGEDG